MIHRVLQQVIDDVQRERQVRFRARGRKLVQQAEFLRRIARKSPAAESDRGWRDVQPQVARIRRERELCAVAATELDDRAHALLADEPVEHARLELRQRALGTAAGRQAETVPAVPVALRILEPREQPGLPEEMAQAPQHGHGATASMNSRASNQRPTAGRWRSTWMYRSAL